MKNLFYIFLIILTLWDWAAEGTVIGIDFGSSFYKVVLVQRDFTLLLNEQSARKTKNVIAFRDGNRYFGSQAENVGRLSPTDSYDYLRNFLGKSLIGSKENLKYINYPQKLHEDQAAFKNGTLTDFTHLSITMNADNEKLAVHEMIGMIFSQIAKMADRASGGPVTDCVITVPVYFTHNQRLALIQAAQLGGLSVLSLINDNTAYALKYAIDRPMPEDVEEETVLFYNHGESSLQLSLVQFQKTRNKKDVIVPQIKVIASVWSTELGTREFDYRLSELYAQKINQKFKTRIQDNLRAMIKLNGELKKGREVLSANKESAFLIEGLTSEIDFGDKLTRDQFESMNEDLFSKIPLLIDSILQSSEIPKESINSIEMVGGAVRIPKIQETVKQYFGRETLDFHINADEGAVFGAAFYAAGLSVHHRVKEMKLKDITPWKVAINISDAQDDSSLEIFQESDDDENLDKFATLFRRGNRYGSRKTLSFYTTRPFKIELKYDDDALPEGINPLIETYYFDGLPTTEHYNFTGKPKVYIQYQLSTSGVIELIKAEAEITVTEFVTKKIPIISPQPVNIQADSEKQEPTEQQQPTEEQPGESQTDEQSNESDDDKSDEQTEEPIKPEEEPDEEADEKSEETTEKEESTEETTEKQQDPDTTEQHEEDTETTPVIEEQYKIEIEEVQKAIRINLLVSSTNAARVPTQIHKRSTRTLKEYEEKDKIRFDTENVKNDLESFIYEVKDTIYHEQVLQFSNEEEREALTEIMNQAGDWLYDNQNAKLEVYAEKKQELLTAADVIFSRVRAFLDEQKRLQMEAQKAKEETERQAQEAAKQPKEGEEAAKQEEQPKEGDEQQVEELEGENLAGKETEETPSSEQEETIQKGDL